MTPGRRVRTLRLAAPEERWIGRGALLVEDALRTASLPWADAGRLLLVRAVDLGTIPAGAAPATVALALERRLRELSLQAVHAAHPDAPRAAAVWFRDAAEAHARLAVKLARGEEAAAWFWPLAVPAWRPGTPRPEALRALLAGALETSAGPAAALELVRTLVEAGGLDLLASALPSADGPWLLRACGWRMPERAAARTAAGLPALLLARWAGTWGLADARTAWLAAMLRAVENPALLGDPGLPGRIAPPAGDESVLDETRARIPFEASPALARASMPGPPGRSRVNPAQGLESGWSRIHPASSLRSPGVHARAGIRAQNDSSGDFSPLAGLFLLLPVFARLGLGAFLEDHPHLLATGFPARLLDRCAQRLGVLEDDPARRAVPIPEESPGRFLAFTAPPVWRQGIAAAPLRVRRRAGGPGVRLLADASGRLDLALWRGRAGEGVRALLAGSAPGRGPVSPPRSDLETALEAWLTASRRWCRRRAGIGLADLVRRAGRVIATRTHVDVFLDPRQVEMRVRRAGLDLDPGWVPWLGLVVRFHYEQSPENLHAG